MEQKLKYFDALHLTGALHDKVCNGVKTFSKKKCFPVPTAYNRKNDLVARYGDGAVFSTE